MGRGGALCTHYFVSYSTVAGPNSSATFSYLAVYTMILFQFHHFILGFMTSLPKLINPENMYKLGLNYRTPQFTGRIID